MAGKRWIPDFLEQGVLSVVDAIASILRMQADGSMNEAEANLALGEAINNEPSMQWLVDAWQNDPWLGSNEDVEDVEEGELTPAEAEAETDAWTESGIAPEDIPTDDLGRPIPLPERGEVKTALERIPDPKGSGRSLVPDTYINAQIKPEEWAVFVPVEWGAPEGPTDPGEMRGRDFAGQLGVRDEEIFEVRPDSPILQSAMGEDFMSLRWEDDPTELGMAFTPAMLEDVPFTMQDAYGVYLAQTPENQDGTRTNGVVRRETCWCY